MDEALTPERLARLRGAPVEDAAGRQIGTLDEIYYDRATGELEWIGIGAGFLKMKRLLVPAQGVEVLEDRLRVPYARETIRETPSTYAGVLDADFERTLYAHYGLRYSLEASPTGLPQAPGSVAEPPAAEGVEEPAPLAAPTHTHAVYNWPEPEFEREPAEDVHQPPVPAHVTPPELAAPHREETHALPSAPPERPLEPAPGTAQERAAERPRPAPQAVVWERAPSTAEAAPRRAATWADSLALAQGVVFAASGAWPVVSARTFQRLTGPRTDMWRVQTVGALIAVSGIALAAAGARRRVTPEMRLLAMGVPAVLAVADLAAARRQRRPALFLLDAAAELALIAAWLPALRRRRRARA